MAPLRKNRARRRALALPFVITTSAAAACVAGNPKPAPTSPAANAAPTEESDTSKGPAIIANPPPNASTTTAPTAGTTEAPVADTAAPTSDAPRIISNPPRLPAAPEGATVRRNDDGTCWWYQDPGPCPAGAICNPPPPKQVQCPPADKK